jgi:hypothetical protein
MIITKTIKSYGVLLYLLKCNIYYGIKTIRMNIFIYEWCYVITIVVRIIYFNTLS